MEIDEYIPIYHDSTIPLKGSDLFVLDITTICSNKFETDTHVPSIKKIYMYLASLKTFKSRGMAKYCINTALF